MVEQRSDPAGCLDELRAALSQPELEELEQPTNSRASPRACLAALQAAIALGYCRLYDVRLDEEMDGVLPARTALAAATALLKRLTEMTCTAAEPKRDGGELAHLAEEEEGSLEMLEGRMDAWAAFVAINEAWQDGLETPIGRADPLQDQLGKAVDLLADATGDLDRRLLARTADLAVAVHTRLLENWRVLLAEPWRDPWPWWLDGTLEHASKANLEEVCATMPGAAEWRRLARAKGRRGFSISVPPPVEEPALAEAEGESEPPRLAQTLVWVSPDQTRAAALDLLTWSTVEHEKMRLPLLFSGNRPGAGTLAGQPIVLGNVSTIIEDNGIASFTLAELREAEELSLLVGPEGEEWLPETNQEPENRTRRPITREVLAQHCSASLETLSPRAALDAIRALGNLAAWWLEPAVLQRGQALDKVLVDSLRQSRLPGGQGICWIVLVRKAQLPLLRSALVLPLCWREDAEHDARLPAELRSLADRVVAGLKNHERIGGRRWGLWLPSEIESCDLSGDPGFTWSSGWAALAGGLVLAAERLRPHRTVWASGAWDENGLAEIEGLAAKIVTAAAFGAEYFFVPSWRVREARELAAGQVEIGALTPSGKDPRFVLSDYLAQLGAEPPPPRSALDEEQFGICRAYYERQPRGREQTEDFYWKTLLPTVIERCRQRVRERWSGWSPEFLVTIASSNPALVPLTARVLGVRKVLVLYTPGDKQIESGVKRIENYFEHTAVTYRIASFEHGPREQLLPRFRELIHSFLSHVRPEQVVFDMTPGKKVMSVTLADIALSGTWMVYLEHTALYDRARPGSEDFDRWRAGEGRESGSTLSE